MTVDFSAWNEPFDKLRYKHDTWYIFRDWLDLTIDNFTIPDQEPLFRNKDKYTDEEYGWFGDMFVAYLNIMNEALEEKPYYDFLGEWWEGDQNMTNKFKAQFFTPVDVCDLMSQLVLSEDLGDEVRVMNDPCCGSGRFALAHHRYRPQDFFMLNDLDDYAVKMTVVNMLVHGMRGVVAHQNTLTEEVFWCCQVTPFLFEYAGLPYVVPYGTDLVGACKMLPRRDVVNVPTEQPTITEINTIDSDKKLGGLDAWL